MAELAAISQVDTPRDIGREGSTGSRTEAKSSERWKSEIERATKHQKDYLKRVDKITARYRVENTRSRGADDNQRRYNVLWSMVNALQPNLFMKLPKPFVDRRYSQKDPIARYASIVLQNVLAYTADNDDTHDSVSAAVDDHILAARGVVWARYQPEFDLRHSETKVHYEDDKEVPENAEKGQDEKGKFYREQYEEPTWEEVETDHVQLVNFIHPAASSWKQVPWVGKRVLMTKDEMTKRFGEEIAKEVPLMYRPDGSKVEEKASRPDESDGLFRVAAVYEIWHKVSKKVYWVCLECPYLLDEREDPLKLKNFFPCPRPLYGTLTNNSLVPVPDFKYYESIANELDDITQRIMLLTQSLRVVGVYDASLGDIVKRITEETDENDMIPVENFQSLADGGGLKGALEFLPIEQIMVVVAKLYEARTALLAELYEITGMSDIIRGTSDPADTATAQRLKGQYASARLKRRQRSVARFARELLEIHAEIICTHYSDDMIMRISNADQIVVNQDGQFDQAMWQQVVALLRNEPMRMFRVKIDNETLAGDELEQNREQGIQFVQAVGQMLSQVIPAMEKNPALGKVARETLMFAVRLFPMARSLEGQMESALDEMANTPPPQPPPPPAELSPDQLMQIEMKKLEIEDKRIDLETRKLEFEQWKGRWELHLNSKKVAAEPELRNKQIDNTHEIGKANIDQKERADQRRAQVEHLKVVATQQESEAQRAHDADQAHEDRSQADAHEHLRHVEAGAEFERDTHQMAMDNADKKVDRETQETARHEQREDTKTERAEDRVERDKDRKVAIKKGSAK